MKFLLFGPDRRLGMLLDHRILDLAFAAEAEGIALPDGAFASLVDLIEAGDRGLDAARTLRERFCDADRADLFVPYASTHLHPPFPGRRLALAGSNFADHIANAYVNHGKPMTADEVRARSRAGKAGGFWVISPPVGPDSEIPEPYGADGLFDYEGELALILGKGGKRLSGEQWMDNVWGTTLVIDWSLRCQNLLSNQRPFYAHKTFDSSKSIGPWIAVDEGVDPTSWDVETRVNGELRQNFNTRDMIHSFGELLEQMSENLTLLPGDVLTSGTGPGTAADKTVPAPNGDIPLDFFLKPGDLVEVTSPCLGTLRGRIIPSM